MKRRQLLTVDDAVPAERQHARPCSDCPWSRRSLPSWLGDLTAEEWLRAAHGEARMECHTLLGAQCAGAATYRANVCKLTHDPTDLRLPVDRESVFTSPREFKAHHANMGKRK